VNRRDAKEEITRDARRELWLIPKALLAMGVVVAIVIARELFIR